MKIPFEDPPKLSFSEFLSTDMSDFLSRCLQKDPNQRWSTKQLLEHSWMALLSKDAKPPTSLVLKRLLMDIKTHQNNSSRSMSTEVEDTILSSWDRTIRPADLVAQSTLHLEPCSLESSGSVIVHDEYPSTVIQFIPSQETNINQKRSLFRQNIALGLEILSYDDVFDLAKTFLTKSHALLPNSLKQLIKTGDLTEFLNNETLTLDLTSPWTLVERISSMIKRATYP